MKDILEYFPLKRYGAIALLYVFPLFSLYYYFVYFPSLNTSRTFGLVCQDPKVFLNYSIPKYISNNSKFNLTIQNLSSNPIDNLKVITILTVLSDFNSSTSYDGPTIFVDDVVVDQLDWGKAENQEVQVRVYDVQDETRIGLENIFMSSNNRFIQGCKENTRYGSVTVYNQFYAWLISVLANIPIALSSIFIGAAISCSITEDDSQDFHPASQLGKYHIARVVFRASIPLTIVFIILYVVNWSLDVGTEIGMDFASDTWAVARIGLAIFYLFFSIIANKIITRVIIKKPKAVIIVDGKGKQKEIEILTPSNSFNMQEFWNEISKTKKH